ncbi:putative DNA-directed RNA polymerase III subunit RPC4 [Melia azedarach]|uniref:DNA-directed RNA polymerase III subunit RPC4 n=2 Tax=Melia azedarach TaxID=155640 RepID=A0ACC1XBZ7_MELAZ|nr:putative DNA-directed RNA polymerase III subunit RPC4 [Melia azedarach]KAJ4708795.1 putative DNA-directed RNA polymerase III subunit RPC4 [Melia azedarach]
MEPEPSSGTKNAPRKMKYAPKAPPRRVPKAEVKTEVVEDADAAQAIDLLQRFNANQGALKGKAKVEKKVAASQIAFGHGGGSTYIKSYGIPKGGSSSNRGQGFAVNGGAYASGLRQEKEYQEPWDYYSYYPVTLPLRRPYSGRPELLDEEEFGEASETINYDENSLNPAEELGLMEENLEPSTFFLQLPPTMPMMKRSATADEQQITGSSSTCVKEKACSLNELPGGFMGKLLVYRSGAVKLKLGDTLYEVTPGMNCVCSQDVVAINTTEKNYCVVGEIDKRATLTPDVDSVLKRFADM